MGQPLRCHNRREKTKTRKWKKRELSIRFRKAAGYWISWRWARQGWRNLSNEGQKEVSR